MRALDIRKDQDYHARPSHQQFGESPFSKHLREQASERQGEHEPTPAPAPPVLDISEEERDALWALIDAFVGSVFESAKAQCREAHASSDYISELSDEVDRTCAAIRSALGFEQGE